MVDFFELIFICWFLLNYEEYKSES